MIQKPRRTSVKSTSMMTCPGEREPPVHWKASDCYSCFMGPTSWSGSHLRACGGDCLTRACVYCRILSLACSPNGASFVCSAAAPSLTSQTDSIALDIGSKGMNQVPGKLLLWDTKTMKQQVQNLSVGLRALGILPGGNPVWRAQMPTLSVFLMSLLPSPLRPNSMSPSQVCCLSPFTEIVS